jgi:hypothetical protein
MNPEVIARRIVDERDTFEITQAGALSMTCDECIHTLVAKHIDGYIRV